MNWSRTILDGIAMAVYPEHFLGWPLVMAPLLSFVQAALGLLCGQFF